jgi:3-methyl-2-oxobutanoate hydroxymethyltransferase
MINDAVLLQDAGASIILLECVPSLLAKEITLAVDIPVIGIGAGSDTDAQVLVLHDMLGITPGRSPKFVKNFMPGNDSIEAAVSQYVKEVKEGSFPAQEHGFE